MIFNMFATVTAIAASAFGTTTPIAKSVLWPIFGLVLVIYAIVSLILVYHWRRYALHNKRVAFAEMLYFIVSGAVLVIALFSLISI